MCLWSAHPHGPFLGPITLRPSLSEIDSAFLQELWVACRFVVADGGPVDRFRRRIRLGMTGGNHLKGCFGRPKLATTTGNRLFLNVCGTSPRRMPLHLAEAPPRHTSNDPRIPTCWPSRRPEAASSCATYSGTQILGTSQCQPSPASIRVPLVHHAKSSSVLVPIAGKQAGPQL